MKKNQMKDNGTAKTIACATALALGGLMACMASVVKQSDPAIDGQGSGAGCIGTYYAIAKMTNSTGLFWLTPPTGTTNGVFQDLSGFHSPYASTTIVTRKSDQTSWCTNKVNTVSFPATSSDSYELVVYVNSATPPPTNGQPLVLQVTWH